MDNKSLSRTKQKYQCLIVFILKYSKEKLYGKIKEDVRDVNRQFLKVTKTKSVFPNDSSLEKMLYLTSVNVMKKWTMRYRSWDLVLSQLNLLYEGRLKNNTCNAKYTFGS